MKDCMFVDALPDLPIGESISRKLAGVIFVITATAEIGFHSGRRRYRVVCSACPVEVHEATTGPDAQIRMHLAAAHADLTP